MAPRARRPHADRRARQLTALAAVLVATAAGAGEPALLGRCGPIARRHEHVEVKTLELKRLRRTPIAEVGVVVRREGAIVPVPFQVDEREGRTIALPGGPVPSADSRPGVLDPDDLVVFMPCDAGTRATPAELGAAVPGLRAWREIEIADPLDGAHGWAYVVVAPTPPSTDRRYVAYEPTGDLVSAAMYRVGLVQALPDYFAVAMTSPLGPNLLDGLRLRAEATLRGGLGTFHLTERDARNELLAWKAGPVRVVRRSRHDVDLLGIGLHVSAGIANTTFYALHVFAPGSMKLPISPGLVFGRIEAMGGVDLRDLRGWRFVASGTPPGGFAIDGEMDAVERAFAADGTWFVLVHGHEAILVTITLSPNLAARIPFGVLYDDDASRSAPPEHVPGHVPLVGFRGRDIERLAADRYRFDLRVFLLPGYDAGDAARVLGERDVPLAVTVIPPAPAAGVPAAPR